MISGTGIDIIEIERINKAIKRWGKNFLEHIFNPEEIEYASQQHFPAQHYAARFAAKEAIYKAIGTGLQLAWKDITILNDKEGQPYCRLSKAYPNKISISLSHSKNYAIANCIISSE